MCPILKIKKCAKTLHPMCSLRKENIQYMYRMNPTAWEQSELRCLGGRYICLDWGSVSAVCISMAAQHIHPLLVVFVLVIGLSWAQSQVTKSVTFLICLITFMIDIRRRDFFKLLWLGFFLFGSKSEKLSLVSMSKFVFPSGCICIVQLSIGKVTNWSCATSAGTVGWDEIRFFAQIKPD